MELEQSSWNKALDRAALEQTQAPSTAWLRELEWLDDQRPALADVWTRAWQQVINATHGKTADPMTRLYQLGLALSSDVAREFERANLPYHNTLHTANVVLLMAQSLSAWQAISSDNNHQLPPWSAEDSALALLCALAHDWGYDGGLSRDGMRLEDISAQRLCIALRRLENNTGDVNFLARLWGSDWIEVIQSMFDATDIHEHHNYHAHWQQCKQQGCTMVKDLLPILMSEADIACSVLPSLGAVQNVYILHEQLLASGARLRPIPAEEAMQSRMTFLSNVHLSSPMAELMGWKQLLHDSLNTIKTITQPTIHRLLAGQSLFSSLSKESIDLLISAGKMHALKQGQVIFRQGEHSQSLYVILSGGVSVNMRDTQGNELILAHLNVGDYLGELHFADGLPHSADAIAETDVTLLKIHRDGFINCIAKSPDIALGMMASISKRLRLASQRSQALAHQNVRDRVVTALQESFSQRQINDCTIDYLTKVVGCNEETALRALSDLQAKSRVTRTAIGWKLIGLRN